MVNPVPDAGARSETNGVPTGTDHVASPQPSGQVAAANSAPDSFLDRVNRFEDTGDRADLDNAIQVGCHEVDSAGAKSTTRARRAGLLANLLFRRFELAECLPDLDAAIEVARRGVVLAPDASEDACLLLSLLGLLLGERFERTEDHADLSAAVEATRKAVADTPKGSSHYLKFLSDLGDILLRRYEEAEDGADVDSAIDAWREVVTLTARQDQPSFGFALGRLAESLLARFELTASETDVRAAVKAAQDSVESLGNRSPEAAGCLSRLGAALRAHFTVSGNPADLNSAVNAGRRAVELTAPGDPSLYGRLSHVARSLVHRFEFAGDRADLRAAIAILRPRASSEDADRELQRRCANLLELLDIPVPDVNLRYLKAAAAETRRLRRKWYASIPVRIPTSSGRARLAYDHWHAFTYGSTRGPLNARHEVAVRHREGIAIASVWACQGSPFILYLRNFDSSDTTETGLRRASHAVLYRNATVVPGRLAARSADDIQGKFLDSRFRVLEASNSHGELDLDRPGYHLYLDQQSWREHISALIDLAEVIVVNAIHVSEGVTAELKMIHDANRVSDTIVIIPSKSGVGDYLDGLYLAESVAKVWANAPYSRWRHKHRALPGLDPQSGPLEFFTANHPLLQGRFLQIVEYGRGPEADETLTLISSLVQARLRPDGQGSVFSFRR